MGFQTISRGGATANEVKAYLDRTFDVYEQLYGIHIKPTDSLGNRFDLIIKTAYEQTGLKVAILIDEYDSPLQHSWKTPEHEGCTEVYRSVFSGSGAEVRGWSTRHVNRRSSSYGT